MAKKARRKLVAEMNVVPYIDVMLVLLVIFMITAPLLTQGVKVDLPQANAKPVPTTTDDQEPLIASVDAAGLFYLNVGEQPELAVGQETFMARAAAVLKLRPNTQVLVKGDTAVDYGYVVAAMVLLQQAGAPNVGLITQPPAVEASSQQSGQESSSQ